MKCLIIAAGRGSRLQLRGNSKPLIPIFGVPLIERVIRSAMDAGVGDFYVVTGYQKEDVTSFLHDLSNRINVSITPIYNEDWKIIGITSRGYSFIDSVGVYVTLHDIQTFLDGWFDE